MQGETNGERGRDKKKNPNMKGKILIFSFTPFPLLKKPKLNHQQREAREEDAGNNGADAADAYEEAATRGASSKLFTDYTRRAYAAYMHGDDAAASRESAACAARFAERDAEAAARVAALRAEVGALNAEAAPLLSGPSPLAAAREAGTAADRDRQALAVVSAKLEEHARALRSSVDAAHRRAAAARAREASLKEDVAVLRGRLAAQTVSTDDVARMLRDAARARESARASLAAARDADARADEAERGLEAEMDELERGPIAEYSKKARALALAPASAKRAGGAHLDVSRLDRAAPADEVALLGGVDLRAAARPAVERLREGAKDRGRELAAEARSLRAELDAATQTAAARWDGVAALRAELEAAEARFAAAKVAADESVAAVEAEAAALRFSGGESEKREAAAAAPSTSSSAAAAAAAAEADADAAEQEAAATQAAAEAELAALDADVASLSDAVSAALDAAIAHKGAVGEAVARVAGVASAARDAVLGEAPLAFRE